MATTTLPYPNMDFVPMDVLTADELDHMVANIEAVNNAGFQHAYKNATNSTSVNVSSSYPTCASTTITTAGTYLIMGGSTIDATAQDYFIAHINVGTTVKQSNSIIVQNGYRGLLATACVSSVNANQTVYYKVGANGQNGKSSDNYIIAIRIA